MFNRGHTNYSPPYWTCTSRRSTDRRP